jgi:hypothetical protein
MEACHDHEESRVMTMKKALIRSLMLLGLAAGPAKATTFNIVFDETSNFFPDSFWTGTFTAPSSGGPITQFDVNIDGTTFNNLIIPLGRLGTIGPAYYGASTNRIQAGTYDPATAAGLDTVVANGSAVEALDFLSSANSWFISGYPNYRGTLASGTYKISAVTPLPASLPLFATGLGVMGLLGWLMKRKGAPILAAV